MVRKSSSKSSEEINVILASALGAHNRRDYAETIVQLNRLGLMYWRHSGAFADKYGYKHLTDGFHRVLDEQDIQDIIDQGDDAILDWYFDPDRYSKIEGTVELNGWEIHGDWRWGNRIDIRAANRIGTKLWIRAESMNPSELQKAQDALKASMYPKVVAKARETIADQPRIISNERARNALETQKYQLGQVAVPMTREQLKTATAEQIIAALTPYQQNRDYKPVEMVQNILASNPDSEDKTLWVKIRKEWQNRQDNWYYSEGPIFCHAFEGESD